MFDPTSLADFGPTLAAIVKGTVAHDVLRYAFGAGGVHLVVHHLLHRSLAHRKIRPVTPGAAQIRREIATSLRTIAIFAAVGTGISLAELGGLVAIYMRIPDLGIAWFLASIVLIIVAQDAWFYWAHRAMHHPWLFRRLHRVHHLSHAPTAFTSYSFNGSEALIHAAFLPAFVALVPMHPAALLVFVVHMMLRNAIGHCGVELFPARRDGRPLFGWLASVTHHDLHHAQAGYNLGLYFTWWDRWMGTEHPRYLQEFARVTQSKDAAAAPGDSDRRKAGLPAVLIGALVLVGLPSGPATAQDTLSGLFAAPGLVMVIRFEPCADRPEQVCGRLVWAWDAADFAHAGPGDVILTGLVPSGRGPGEPWTGGRLIHPQTGATFRGSVRPTAQGDLELKGCAGPFCIRQTWRRLAHLHKELAGLDHTR
ncbi:MAG: sterol desaturase family protein [Marinibacterium sp.]